MTCSFVFVVGLCFISLRADGTAGTSPLHWFSTLVLKLFQKLCVTILQVKTQSPRGGWNPSGKAKWVFLLVLAFFVFSQGRVEGRILQCKLFSWIKKKNCKKRDICLHFWCFSMGVLTLLGFALPVQFYSYKLVQDIVLLFHSLQHKFNANFDIRLLTLKEKLPPYTSPNQKSLGDLFIGFLRYYATKFE